MVEDYKKKHWLGLLCFIKGCKNDNFYTTKNNERCFIRDESSLKQFLKECRDVRIIEELGDILGVIGLWVAKGNNINRDYVKINAINQDIFDRLITVTVWNAKKDLFIKIKKDSKFIEILKNKGFEFLGVRGSEVLMMRSKYRKREIKHDKHN